MGQENARQSEYYLLKALQSFVYQLVQQYEAEPDSKLTEYLMNYSIFQKNYQQNIKPVILKLQHILDMLRYEGFEYYFDNVKDLTDNMEQTKQSGQMTMLTEATERVNALSETVDCYVMMADFMVDWRLLNERWVKLYSSRSYNKTDNWLYSKVIQNKNKNSNNNSNTSSSNKKQTIEETDKGDAVVLLYKSSKKFEKHIIVALKRLAENLYKFISNDNLCKQVISNNFYKNTNEYVPIARQPWYFMTFKTLESILTHMQVFYYPSTSKSLEDFLRIYQYSDIVNNNRYSENNIDIDWVIFDIIKRRTIKFNEKKSVQLSENGLKFWKNLQNTFSMFKETNKAVLSNRASPQGTTKANDNNVIGIENKQNVLLEIEKERSFNDITRAQTFVHGANNQRKKTKMKKKKRKKKKKDDGDGDGNGDGDGYGNTDGKPDIEQIKIDILNKVLIDEKISKLDENKKNFLDNNECHEIVRICYQMTNTFLKNCENKYEHFIILLTFWNDWYKISKIFENIIVSNVCETNVKYWALDGLGSYMLPYVDEEHKKWDFSDIFHTREIITDMNDYNRAMKVVDTISPLFDFVPKYLAQLKG